MARMPKIKKLCPFCGSEDRFVERSDFSSAFVQCNDCQARGPTACQESDEEETPGERAAIKAWNQRWSRRQIRGAA